MLPIIFPIEHVMSILLHFFYKIIKLIENKTHVFIFFYLSLPHHLLPPRKNGQNSRKLYAKDAQSS